MIKETIAYHKDYSISCSRKNTRQLFYSNGGIISLDCTYSDDESDLIFRTKSGEKYYKLAGIEVPAHVDTGKYINNVLNIKV